MKDFITLRCFDRIQKRPCSINFIVREDDGDLHLGDKFFLLKIAEKLSNIACLHVNEVEEFDVVLTLPRRLKYEKGPAIAIDWSAKKPLPPEIMILKKLGEINLCSDIFYDAKPNEKVVVVSSEIASTPLRILGLKKRMVSILELFFDQGFSIVHIGKNSPEFLYKSRIKFTVVSGLKECKDVISSDNVYAFVGFDNYWMHVALAYERRMYVIQRRKFLRTNLTNHMCSLNYMSSKDNIITYV